MLIEKKATVSKEKAWTDRPGCGLYTLCEHVGCSPDQLSDDSDMTAPISGFPAGARSQHANMVDTHTVLPSQRSLIFVRGMGTESQVHILHLAVDAAF